MHRSFLGTWCLHTNMQILQVSLHSVLTFHPYALYLYIALMLYPIMLSYHTVFTHR